MATVCLFFIFISIIQLINCFGCPPNEIIEPCTCIDANINCYGTSWSSFELVDFFTRISRESNVIQFNTLSIHGNSNLTELRANTFQDVAFNEIEISNCPNLVDVHEYAFTGVQNIATKLKFQYTGKSLSLK